MMTMMAIVLVLMVTVLGRLYTLHQPGIVTIQGVEQPEAALQQQDPAAVARLGGQPLHVLLQLRTALGASHLRPHAVHNYCPVAILIQYALESGRLAKLGRRNMYSILNLALTPCVSTIVPT